MSPFASVKDVAKVVTRAQHCVAACSTKAGIEAVGGVVVVRYGFNPLDAIKNVKKKIDEFDDGLPTKAVVDYRKVTRDEVIAYANSNDFDAFTSVELNHDHWVKHLRSFAVDVDYGKTTREEVERFGRDHGFVAFSEAGLNEVAWLTFIRETPPSGRPNWLIAPHDQWPEWVTTSQVTVIPFYDRTGLIYETLGTLETALLEEILVTIIVILVMVMHLRSSILISALLPLAVLMCFIAMSVSAWLANAMGASGTAQYFNANIVALSGIAIAIGTMVDMGVILCENILNHLDEADPESENRLEVVYRAASEVGGAVVTAVATTIVSFLPVFTMIGAEGKLFKPLAFTKTFRPRCFSHRRASTIIPPVAHILFTVRVQVHVYSSKLLYAGLDLRVRSGDRHLASMVGRYHSSPRWDRYKLIEELLTTARLEHPEAEDRMRTARVAAGQRFAAVLCWSASC